MAGARQGMSQSADDQAAHQGGVAKAHLGLGGVDIDVHEAGFKLHIEGGDRMPVPCEKVGVGAAEGALDQPVLHRDGR